MKKDSRIFVAGHRGTLGSALLDELKKDGYTQILTRTRQELDLTNQQAVRDFFEKQRPEFVFFAAVLPCGASNFRQRADFIYENTAMQTNIIHSCFKFGVKKLICYGSGYMYPYLAQNPLKEEVMLKDEMEYNATPFGLAKINQALMCESFNLQYNTNFICLAINNLYGTRANFDFNKSRVLPALLRKFHLAKLLEKGDEKGLLQDLNTHLVSKENKFNSLKDSETFLNSWGISKDKVEIWGTGKVRREFLHSIDAARASIFVMQNVDFKNLHNNEKEIKNTHINVGTGVDYSIKEVALMIKEELGFKGEIYFNASRPDSSMDRLMDISRLNSLGFKAEISLKEGIKKMYAYYLASTAGGGG
ncbi:NAD-dependent epimerase/dehydratase family protein [Campylobacter troglodytis]|uniref:NAD-dependent epimerase/dehydratase family protein n=1 Tax=Campylobacter troglodytis TaxID=654363 RepID=UPI00115B7677|nr:NAD-dependent epimerase/dehydratase family protein [Campylobacter troglodytis]TQR61276.1 GDP-fucose synthetase [Campylobacter troglodytis]